MKKIICFLIAVLLVIPINASAVGTSAKGAILINGDTGEVIYEQNADARLPMASTTKIMTGLLLCENGDFDREITVTAEMLRVEGSSMGLLAGDKVTLHDLLYGLMLASGNDAANVVAFVLGGTVDGFVRMMNDKAKSLGLENTSFETPSGLDSENHYTTARDLASLARFAMQNEEFAKAVSTKTAVLNYGNPPYRRSLTNHNRLLKSFDGAVGIKTGFTKKSGRCLVSAAKRDGKYVIAVTLYDPNDWKDHTELLEYGLGEIKSYEINPPQKSYDVPIIGSEQECINVKIEPYRINTLTESDFNCKINLPKFLYAPIKKGEQIGTAVYMKENNIIAEKPLYTDCDIDIKTEELSGIEQFLRNVKYIFKNIWEK